MTAAAARPSHSGGRRLSAALLLIPILLLNAVVFFWPILNLFKMSFIRADGTGALTNETTIANWTGVLKDSFYGELLWQSVSTSVLMSPMRTMRVGWRAGLTMQISAPTR